MSVTRGLAACCLLAAACGGDGGDGGDSGDDDGDVEETTPILELPPRLARTCTVATPATMIDDGFAYGFELATLGGRHHVVTTRGDEAVHVAELSLDPLELRAPTWMTTTQSFPYPPAVARREGGGLVIAWFEQRPVTTSVTVVLDENGMQVGATRELEVYGLVYEGELVARPGGFARAWYEPPPSAQAGTRLVLLDADAAPTGPPMTVVTKAGRIARHGDGFVMAWFEDVDGRTSVHVVLLDANGVARTEPREVFARRGVGAAGMFMTGVGSELWLAWEEHVRPDTPGDESGYAIVRLARLGADGALVAPVQRLQAPEIGLVNVNPTLLPLGDTVALSWSRGDYIAVCGGCVSDNRMHLVLLDPVDLAPVSNIAEVVGPAGLRSAPIASLDGVEIAYLLAIDRHARFDLAGAMVRCE